MRTRSALSAAVIVSLLAGAVGARDDARRDQGFAVRMVKLGGFPGDPSILEHVKYCRELGFNALWVYGQEAGVWAKDRATVGPSLYPAFLDLTRWCRRHGMDVWVSINPVAESSGKFVFSEPEDQQRVLAFASLLREKADVRRIVVSFDDQPSGNRELADVFRYGDSAAPAHLELVARLAAELPKDVGLWLCAAAYCDAHLADGAGPYAKAFLAGLAALPPGVGIVWTGPKVVSPTITRADLLGAKTRLGGRPLLLYDNFPAYDDDVGDAMAMSLASLGGRDAGIRDVVAAYLATLSIPPAGARLTLLTIAEYLRDPEAYDSDAAAARAIKRLAGRDKEAATALGTQQIEWGGFLGRNYFPRDAINPELTARRLDDPAFVDSFTWTVARYPGRMAAIGRIADEPFRKEVLRMMRRRLAIARAVPLTIEYLERVRTRRADPAQTLAKIDAERRSWQGDPDAHRELELFLAAAGVPGAGGVR